MMMILAHVILTETNGDAFEHLVELDAETPGWKVAEDAEAGALEDLRGCADIASAQLDYYEWVDEGDEGGSDDE